MRRVHLRQTDSTNAEAERLLRRGEVAPFLVSADVQTAGRGRDGRQWHSPAGGSWMTAAIPLIQPPERYQPFPLVAGLAAHDAICRTAEDFGCPLPADALRIKWPNDLLLAEQKVCGVLCQTAATGSEITHLLAGVGVNVTFDPSGMGVPLRHPPTCLARHVAATEQWIGVLIGAFADALAMRAAQFEAHGFAGGADSLAAEVARRLAWVGKPRAWHTPGQSLQGTLRGIDPTGRLLLDCDSGPVALESGELVSAFQDVSTTISHSYTHR
jgi:BirA family biotin operon repressor/biotin-[acetyl-CoA-carboxylase] ligase